MNDKLQKIDTYLASAKEVNLMSGFWKIPGFILLISGDFFIIFSIIALNSKAQTDQVKLFMNMLYFGALPALIGTSILMILKKNYNKFNELRTIRNLRILIEQAPDSFSLDEMSIKLNLNKNVAKSLLYKIGINLEN